MNKNLNIMRMLAAFMVLMVHVGQNFEWISRATAVGYYGIFIFFILSGYLIMKSLEKVISLKEFYIKRAIRIVPIYWLVLIIELMIRGEFGIRYLRYFFFLQMFIPSDNWDLWNNMNGLWTLSSFFLFYLIAPFIYRFVKKYYASFLLTVFMFFIRKPQVIYLTSLLERQQVDNAQNFAEWTPISILYVFMLGVTIYYAVKEDKTTSLAFCLIAALIYNSFSWYGFELVMALFLIVSVKLPEIRMNKYADIIVMALAQSSFTLYLLHPLVLTVLIPMRDLIVPYIRHKGFLVLVICICYLLAYFMWKYIEKPIEDKLTQISRQKLDVG